MDSLIRHAYTHTHTHGRMQQRRNNQELLVSRGGETMRKTEGMIEIEAVIATEARSQRSVGVDSTCLKGWGESKSESESENTSDGVGRGEGFLSLLVITL